jgi:hypothetical protein
VRAIDLIMAAPDALAEILYFPPIFLIASLTTLEQSCRDADINRLRLFQSDHLPWRTIRLVIPRIRTLPGQFAATDLSNALEGNGREFVRSAHARGAH